MFRSLMRGLLPRPAGQSQPSRRPPVEALENRVLLAATFQGLGDLPGGLFSNSPAAVSADGSTVVGTSSSDRSDLEAFRWTAATGMVGLGFLPGGGRSFGMGVSGNGSVVVGYGSSPMFLEDPYRWTAETGMVRLEHLPAGYDPLRPGYTGGAGATDVSADGSVVVGGSWSSTGYQAVRWTAATGPVGLGGMTSSANAVSADGSVVVGQQGAFNGATEAFRWTAATGRVGLGDLPGGSLSLGSTAYGVSADGAVVVGTGTSGSGTEAFRWTAATGMVGLGDLPGGDFYSFARTASADGSVVVGAGNTASGPEAIIWDSAHGMQRLRDVLVAQGADPAGWQLTSAEDISADGRTVVGVGRNPAGHFEAWIAHLTPPAQPVQIDIKPGKPPNFINLKANGVLAVAVLTTPDFDASSIDTSDLSRIRFGDVDVAARVSPIRSALEDVDGDGDTDLILHFSTRQIREAGALSGASTLAELTGFTTAGTSWRGTDPVRIVPGGGGQPGHLHNGR